MSAFNEDTEQVECYTVTPKDKKSVREEIVYTKLYENLRVKLIVTKTWRYGKFEVELTKKQADNIITIDNVKLNDYGAMIECTDNLHEQNIMIHDIDNYPDYIQKKIWEDVYEDLEHDITFDEGDLVDKYGWELDDTIYTIDGGVVLNAVEHEDEDEDEDEDEIYDGEFKCEDCGTVQGLNNCELCDAENICEECHGQGGDYGRNEIWVCHQCLPVCLECNATLYNAFNKCCGKGRSDITDDEDDEDDENNQEPEYYNIYRCKYCDASTSSDNTDCPICSKKFCMMLVKIQHTSDINSKDEAEDKQEQTENKKSHGQPFHN